MKRRLIPLGALAGLLLATSGCNTPKDSCEGTLDSFKGCINAQDWQCICDLMHPAERKKFTDRRIRGMFAEDWFGVHSYRWTFMQADTAKSGDVCVARTKAAWTKKIRGKAAEDVKDWGDVYTLHPIDGLWYIDVPGSQKLSGY